MSDPSFRIKKFALLSLFERAVKVVRTKDITEILKNFLVEVDDSELRVVATDLELSVLATTTVFEAVAVGRAVLPAHKVLEIAKEAPDDEVLIQVEGKRASIICEDGSWELPVGNANEYPPLPNVSEIELAPIDRKELLEDVSKVLVAASSDGLRPALMVVKLEPEFMIATDGVRVHRVEPSWRLPFSFFLPLGAAMQMVSLLKLGVMDELLIGEGSDHIVFKIDGDVFLTTKVVVDYPDMEPFLKSAQANSIRISLDKKELLNAISRVRLTADQDTNLLLMGFEDKTLTLSAASKDGQRSTWRVQMSDVVPTMEAGFNWRYLREAIEAVSSPGIVLRVNEDQKTRQPVLIEDGNYTALLRQLKL